MSIEFDKTDEVIRAVKGKATRVALKAGIIDIHRQAVALAPVDTGNLKGSLTWTVAGEVGGLNSPGGKSPKSTPKRATPDQGVNRTDETDTAYLGTNVHYAPYLEYGTSRIGAQPFLRRAVDEREKYTSEIMSKHYKKIIEQELR